MIFSTRLNRITFLSSLSSFWRQVSFSNAMSPLLAKFSLEKQDCTVKNLAKSVYFLIQKLLRLGTAHTRFISNWIEQFRGCVVSAATCRIFTTELYQINSSSLNLVKRAQCHKVKGRSEKSLFCHHYAKRGKR